MSNSNAIRLDVYPSKELRKALDRWRIEQEPVLSRAEAGRVLIEDSLVRRGYITNQTDG